MSILNESLASKINKPASFDTKDEPVDLSPRDGASFVVGSKKPELRHLTIPQLFRETVARHGPRDAVVLPGEDRILSYYELDREVDAVASGLLALGLETGDRLGIWSPNRLEWILTQFATARIGVVLVNINPSYRESELEYALNKVGCKALILAERSRSSEYLKMVHNLAPELATCVAGRLSAAKLPTLRIVVVMSDTPGDGVFGFSDIQTLGGPAQQLRLDSIAESLKPDDPINIQFTSGTTGAPKGATLTHYNIVNNASFTVDRINMTETDRLCIPVPLYHCFGMVLGTLGCVSKGAAMVIPGEIFDAHQTLSAISVAECTVVYGVPTMFVAMLEQLNSGSYDLSHLRTGIMAGAPCPIEVMHRVVDEMNMSEVTIGYGMTETSPISFQSFVDDLIEKRVTTVGRIHPHLEVKIIRDDGTIAPVGEQGELCTKGYSVMQGYWNDKEQTAAAIDADGWMHTGDLAVFDDEGYCDIVGRLKDMIIRGGENIYPREIEDFLFKHPDVKEAQVFGIPDERLGEEVCAWIVPKANTSLSAESIKSFCAGQIAHFKVPKHIRIVAELPTTATGKPQKFAMRNAMIENPTFSGTKTAPSTVVQPQNDRNSTSSHKGSPKMSWINNSIMGKRAVASGQAGAYHHLTEAGQGEFHYVYGPYSEPVMRIQAGDLVEVETLDAFGGAIKSESDLPSQVLTFPFVNPQNGPITVAGAEKGDVLAVYIHSVLPRGPQPAGTTALIPGFGALVADSNLLLNAPITERVKKMEVTPEGVKFSDRIMLPFEPFVGTMGVSPEIEAVSSLQPDYWGGNMDLPDVAPGTVMYFPVQREGAHFFLGDCHGRQGDGELCGVAVEIAATVIVQIDLIKCWSIPGVRLETEDFIMSVGSARPMEDAARMAYRDLVRWLVSDYGFEETEAYFLATQAGKMRVGNMVDPKYTLGASIRKEYIG